MAVGMVVVVRERGLEVDVRTRARLVDIFSFLFFVLMSPFVEEVRICRGENNE